MENGNEIKQIDIAGPEAVITIKKHPSMIFIFIKAVLISLLRSNTIDNDAKINKSRFVLKNFRFDQQIIHDYKTICGFTNDDSDIVPISYLQSLFIGLFGKYIISSYFPITPLGLVHIFQSFEQTRAIRTDETIDLSCHLDQVTKTERGIETTFILNVSANNEIIWQGTSVFLTKSNKKKKKRSPKTDEILLKEQEIILVPKGTGQKYAKVSGDYNPHHLYSFLAKLFGFKRAIAHGMWSLASVIGKLDRTFSVKDKCRIEAYFKLPIFMPATTSLGFETECNDQEKTIVNFELRDNQEGLPHLKGKLLL